MYSKKTYISNKVKNKETNDKKKVKQKSNNKYGDEYVQHRTYIPEDYEDEQSFHERNTKNIMSDTSNKKMTNFLSQHMWCYLCLQYVEMDKDHFCIKSGETFRPNNNWHCAWCRKRCNIIMINNRAACSICKHPLHGSSANPRENMVHGVLSLF